jgi:CheY-like chemotaxis protein
MAGPLGNRLLLVDDEPLIRKLISGSLVAAGYIVQTAGDGLDALGKLRAGLPDLIITDLNMPRMSGYELLAVIRKRFPQIPVIVMSSLPSDEMQREVTADAYYHKSGFGFQQLFETIFNLTRKLPLPTAPRPIDNEPVRAGRDGIGHYVIACDGCLREFHVPGVDDIIRGEKWTTCVHCGNLVRFLVAEG